MKNKLTDLNNHLFSQIERLNDEDLTKDPDKLNVELKRTQAMSNIAKQIINNATLALDAQKFIDNAMDAKAELPEMLEHKKNG